MATEAEKARAADRTAWKMAEPTSGPAAKSRPTGEPTIAAGTYAMGAAIVVAIASGLFVPEHWLALVWISGGVFQLGFMIFCLGQVQKALWFLPGREPTP